jgi:ABC-2 type transport system ATP-binding protein
VSEPPIRAERLSRFYGDVIGLMDVTIDVPPGITGLLGKNGAGKSSFLRVAAGEIRPSQGHLTIFGTPPFANAAVHRRTGYAPEGDRFFPEARAGDFLVHLLRLSGYVRREARRRAAAALEEVGLPTVFRKRLAACSRGMRQRVKIASAMAHDPDLLLLDEPLSGLDPLARREAQDLIRRRAERGATVLVSSHVLHEVEHLTRNILLVNRGRIAAAGDVSEIRALLSRFPRRIRIECADPKRLGALLLAEEGLTALRFEEGALVAETDAADRVYAALPGLVAGHGIEVTGIESPDDRLETVYDLLVGGGAE